MNERFKVSVVIPTTDRVDFLKRSVSSVFEQTYLPEEIIVVIDGHSNQSSAYLDRITSETDMTIRYVETTNPLGGSEARNLGVKMATGDLIAFLDDDDEWYATKLSKQIQLIQNADISISDSFLCFTSLNTYSDPLDKKLKKLPNEDYKYSNKIRLVDYLFETEGFKNIGFIQTSTVLVPRWLAVETPFTKDLAKHQDWDWLLKLETEHSLRILQVEEPQVIYHSDVPKNKRVGYNSKWLVTKDFYYTWFSHFSENGRSSFVLNYLMNGVSELTELSKLKKVKWCGGLIKNLPNEYLYRRYTVKSVLYATKNIFKK